MSRPKLTREEKDELGRWTIYINRRVRLDPETHEPVKGSGTWGIDVMRGQEYYSGFGGFKTFDEALRIALSRQTRGELSPLGYGKPIPPRQVVVAISAKYLRKNNEFREALSDLLTETVRSEVEK